jgi:hypothetical protein
MPKTRGGCWNNTRSNLSHTLALVALTALGVWSWVNVAYAADVARVSIVDLGSVELARKLRAEAAYAGFEVARSSAASVDNAPAVVFQVESPERVALAFNRPDGNPVPSQVLTPVPGEGDGFALRVVEAVRARLVDLGWEVPGPITPTQPSASPRAALVEREPKTRSVPALDNPTPAAKDDSESPHFWLGAGATGTFAAGGLGLLPLASLSLRADISSNWGASLTGFVPLAEGEVQQAEGTAEVAWYGVTAGVHLLLPLGTAWFADGGLGAGVSLFEVDGKPSDGFVADEAPIYTGCARVELGFAWRPLDWLRLRAHALGGLTVPRPVLRFDGREVASVGRPHAGLGLTLEGGFELGAENQLGNEK